MLYIQYGARSILVDAVHYLFDRAMLGGRCVSVQVNRKFRERRHRIVAARAKLALAQLLQSGLDVGFVRHDIPVGLSAHHAPPFTALTIFWAASSRSSAA